MNRTHTRQSRHPGPGTGHRAPGTGRRIADRGSRIADRVGAQRPRQRAFDIAHGEGHGVPPSAASRRGQTATEYLMIAGIMTAIGLLVLLWFYQPWRTTVQDVTDCVRTDDCDAVGAK